MEILASLKTSKFVDDIMLKELLADIISVDDVLLVVKSNGATSEMRSNSLSIRQKDQWITIGDNDGPCHMHVNPYMIKHAQFVIEESPNEPVADGLVLKERGQYTCGKCSSIIGEYRVFAQG